MKYLYITTAICFSLWSCTQGRSDQMEWSEYRSWLSDQPNGMLKSKPGKHVKLTASFQPADLLIFKEIRASGSHDPVWVDSLRQSYAGALNFQLEVVANDPKVNLLWLNAANYADYKDRVNRLSFHGEDYLELTIGDNPYRPLMVHFEGYNELSNRLLLHVAFEVGALDNLDREEPIRVTFEDPYWGSGINHFTFRKRDLVDIPRLIFG